MAPMTSNGNYQVSFFHSYFHYWAVTLTKNGSNLLYTYGLFPESPDFRRALLFDFASMKFAYNFL
jgi:hypothetical protein